MMNYVFPAILIIYMIIAIPLYVLDSNLLSRCEVACVELGFDRALPKDSSSKASIVLGIGKDEPFDCLCWHKHTATEKRILLEK